MILAPHYLKLGNIFCIPLLSSLIPYFTLYFTISYCIQQGQRPVSGKKCSWTWDKEKYLLLTFSKNNSSQWPVLFCLSWTFVFELIHLLVQWCCLSVKFTQSFWFIGFFFLICELPDCDKIRPCICHIKVIDGNVNRVIKVTYDNMLHKCVDGIYIWEFYINVALQR